MCGYHIGYQNATMDHNMVYNNTHERRMAAKESPKKPIFIYGQSWDDIKTHFQQKMAGNISLTTPEVLAILHQITFRIADGIFDQQFIELYKFDRVFEGI